MSRAARIEYEKLGPLSEKEKAVAKCPLVMRDGRIHVLTPDGRVIPFRTAYEEGVE